MFAKFCIILFSSGRNNKYNLLLILICYTVALKWHLLYIPLKKSNKKEADSWEPIT